MATGYGEGGYGVGGYGIGGFLHEYVTEPLQYLLRVLTGRPEVEETLSASGTVTTNVEAATPQIVPRIETGTARIEQ